MSGTNLAVSPLPEGDPQERVRAEAINRQLQQYKQEGAHVPAPLTFQSIPKMHRPVLVVVQINALPAAKETYSQRGGGKSLSALAFQKFADAMGIQWDPKLCGRVDDGHDPNVVHYRMVGRIKALDGTWRTIMGDKEIRMETVIQELTDNYREKAEAYVREGTQDFLRAFPTPEAREGWVREKVRTDALQIKKHMLARAQTGAMARAIKSLGIRETYTEAELSKPFVFPKLVPDFDPRDPGDREFMRRQAAGFTDLAYPVAEGPRTALPGEEHQEPIEIHAIPEAAHEPVVDTKKDPSPAESARADFMAADPAQQATILQGLVKQKDYKGKVQGDLAKWKDEDRVKFYDHLVAMPDKTQPAGMQPLPFDDKK